MDQSHVLGNAALLKECACTWYGAVSVVGCVVVGVVVLLARVLALPVLLLHLRGCKTVDTSASPKTTCVCN